MNNQVDPEELAKLREHASYGHEAARVVRGLERLVVGFIVAGVLYALWLSWIEVLAAFIPLLVVWGILWFFFRQK